MPQQNPDTPETGTDWCVSPALLDVAAPTTTITLTSAITLAHVHH